MVDEDVRTQRYGGRMVRVGVSPGAGPTVLLLGGCGVPHTLWAGVIDGLTGRRVAWLDRPGMAGTRWPGEVPTLATEVATLTDLGRALGPLVVVAHSMASFAAEAVTRQLPELVGGLVLVDGSVEWRAPRPAAVAAGESRRWAAAAHLTRLVATPGWVRRPGRTLLQRILGIEGPRWHLAGINLADLASDFADPDTLAMTVAEFGAYSAQADDLMAIRGALPWPLVPTEVLTARRGSDEAWFAAQYRLARLLGARTQLVDTGHNMMLERPDVMIDAVRRLAR